MPNMVKMSDVSLISLEGLLTANLEAGAHEITFSYSNTDKVRISYKSEEEAVAAFEHLSQEIGRQNG